MSRSQFEQLKTSPQEQVPQLLLEEGVVIRFAEPRLLEITEEPVNLDEYAVYTAVCRQFDMFRFNNPDTIFEDHTSGDIFVHPSTRKYLKYDERRKEYRVIEPSLAERFSEPFIAWIGQHPEDVEAV